MNMTKGLLIVVVIVCLFIVAAKIQPWICVGIMALMVVGVLGSMFWRMLKGQPYKNKVKMIRRKMTPQEEARIRKRNSLHEGSFYYYGYENLCEWQCCVCGRIYPRKWQAEYCLHGKKDKNLPWQ
jgi:hypothetical protein